MSAADPRRAAPAAGDTRRESAIEASLRPTTTMTISLPVKAFVDAQATERGHASSSEYVRELIRQDQDRQSMRATLLETASSPPSEPVDDAYFARLRKRASSGNGTRGKL